MFNITGFDALDTFIVNSDDAKQRVIKMIEYMVSVDYVPVSVGEIFSRAGISRYDVTESDMEDIIDIVNDTWNN